MSHVKRLTQDRPPKGCIFMKSPGTVATVRVSVWTLLKFLGQNHICAIMQILQIFSWKYANCTTGLLQPDWNVNVHAFPWLFYTCRQFLQCFHHGNLFDKVHTVLDHLKYDFTVNLMSCLRGFTSANAVTELELSAEFAVAATFWRVSVQISDK